MFYDYVYVVNQNSSSSVHNKLVKLPNSPMKKVADTNPPPRLSLVESAYTELKRRIVDNVYPPNQRILEQELAEDLGMSRTPVREALIRLEKDGLIELIPRQGMRVLPLSIEDMKHIYEALTCLEPAAAEMFAKRKPDADELVPLKQAVRDMDQALADQDLDAWAEADERYHRYLLEHCGNPRIAAMALGVMDVVRRARLLSLRLLPPPMQSNKEHAALVVALQQGDYHTAREIHERQRRRASKAIIEALQRFHLNDI
jgi:DNA-binding GntR family transcriptional regulator